jgi:hypothetical protein
MSKKSVTVLAYHCHKYILVLPYICHGRRTDLKRTKLQHLNFVLKLSNKENEVVILTFECCILLRIYLTGSL